MKGQQEMTARKWQTGKNSQRRTGQSGHLFKKVFDKNKVNCRNAAKFFTSSHVLMLISLYTLLKQFLDKKFFWPDGFWRNHIKGTVSRDFLLWFFHQATFPGLVRHAYKGFRIFSNIRGVNRIRKWLPSVYTTRESWLSGVFITG
jgi:hypothetical protein